MSAVAWASVLPSGARVIWTSVYPKDWEPAEDQAQALRDLIDGWCRRSDGFMSEVWGRVANVGLVLVLGTPAYVVDAQARLLAEVEDLVRAIDGMAVALEVEFTTPAERGRQASNMVWKARVNQRGKTFQAARGFAAIPTTSYDEVERALAAAGGEDAFRDVLSLDSNQLDPEDFRPIK